MSPLTFAGVGWILIVLGVSGPLGAYVGVVGVATALVGVYRVRWRNPALTVTFWVTVALLVSLLGLFAPVRAGFLHILVIAVLQTCVGVGLATGVRDCLLDGGAKPTDRPVAQLRLVRTLVVATFAATVVAVMVAGLLFALPAVTLFLLGLVSLAVNLWLGVLLLRLRSQPTVQEHSTAPGRRA